MEFMSNKLSTDRHCQKRVGVESGHLEYAMQKEFKEPLP